MTKLAIHSDVNALIKFPGDIEEINVSINASLETATSNLEKDLRIGSFTRATRFDLFPVIQRELSQGIFEYHLGLSRGFIDSGETFTVKVGTRISDFDNGTATDITEQAIIDHNLGAVSIVVSQTDDVTVPGSNSRLIGNFIRIDYTSGFNEDENTGFFNEDEVPSWLKQAAIINGVVVLDSIDPTLRSADPKNPINPKILQNTYFMSIEARIKYLPKHQQPIAKS